jgi:Na+-translocating ferredoxin:NAD+ oxidoreductase subunit A
MSWLGLILLFALVDNVFLSRLLGVCPSPGAPADMRVAVGIGVSTAILMAVSSTAAWALNVFVLDPFGIAFLRTPLYVLLIAALALLLDAVAARVSPILVRGNGYSVPAVAISSATLGVVLITTHGGYNALQSLVAGVAAGLGYLFVLLLMSSIQDRLDIEQTPPALRGFPLHLISAGLLAYAFMAFDKAFLARLLGA